MKKTRSRGVVGHYRPWLGGYVVFLAIAIVPTSSFVLCRHQDRMLPAINSGKLGNPRKEGI